MNKQHKQQVEALRLQDIIIQLRANLFSRDNAIIGFYNNIIALGVTISWEEAYYLYLKDQDFLEPFKVSLYEELYNRVIQDHAATYVSKDRYNNRTTEEIIHDFKMECYRMKDSSDDEAYEQADMSGGEPEYEDTYYYFIENFLPYEDQKEFMTKEQYDKAVKDEWELN
jgi:hypothetical protein